MSSGAIPAVVVGGYLGAGKTTLINAFLKDPGGLRATVLVNDFGAINIDADLIENARGDTIALTNGCACCSIGDSLLEAALRATAAAPPPDLLIVEASGVSHPRRIADTLMGVAALAPATCLTVVNGARLARNLRDRFTGRLFRAQIEAADFLALNRFETPRGQACLPSGPPKPQVGSIAELLEQRPRGAGPTTGQGPAPAPEDGFCAMTVSLQGPLTRARLEAWIGSFPAGVERMKGVVLMGDGPGDAGPVLVSWSQGLLDIRAASPGQAAGCGTVVLIARSGAPADIRFPAPDRL